MKPLHSVPLLALVSLAACGGGAAGDAVTVRDSAGIQIVENRGGQWGQDDAWRLSDQPVLRIGVAEGDAAYQLDGVGAALRLADGRIAVANAGSKEIRYYDPRGRHLLSAGREGGGPGEFRSLMALRRLPGDSLLAYDLSAFRLSWLDPAGRFVRSAPLTPVGAVPPRFVDRLADGSLLLSASLRQFGASPPDGMHRDTLQWLRLAPDGALDSLPITPGGQSHYTVTRSAGQAMSMRVLSTPFMYDVQTAAGPEGYWQGTTDAYEVVLRRADGTPVRIVRKAVQPVPVKGAYLDSLRRVQAAQYGEEGSGWIDEVPAPGALPAFQRLMVDDDGALWVQHLTWPGAGVQPAWDVFGADGRMLGTVRMPPRFRATHIGADFVLGVGLDEDDVQQVRMYRLEKPAAER